MPIVDGASEIGAEVRAIGAVCAFRNRRSRVPTPRMPSRLTSTVRVFDTSPGAGGGGPIEIGVGKPIGTTHGSWLGVDSGESGCCEAVLMGSTWFMRWVGLM